MSVTIHTLIARYNLLSHGTTASPNAGGSPVSEHPGGRRPPGGGMSGQDWLDRYNNSGKDQRVLDELEHEIAHHTKSTADREITETAEQLTARIRAKLTEGWTVKEVAMHCRCTETRVRQAQAGTDDIASRVTDLHAQGKSVRSIALTLGIPKSTVHRHLTKAA